MSRGKRGINQVMLLLVTLVVIAIALAATLILLIIKQNNGKGSGNGTSNESGYSSTLDGTYEATGELGADGMLDNDGTSSDYGQADDTQNSNVSAGSNTGAQTGDLPVLGKDKNRNAYSIKFANQKKLSAVDVAKIADGNYALEFDLDGDEIAEKYQIGFAYDAVSNKTTVNILEGGAKKASAEIENALESTDCIDVVTVSNNDGKGVAAICKTFDEGDNKYVIQAIVWEYVNDVLTKQWDMVYTGRNNQSNGFMKDGYIHGLVRGENVNYATDSHMNGYILNRSTLMADMKNLGIMFPKDTTGECIIEYGKYASGVVRVVVE